MNLLTIVLQQAGAGADYSFLIMMVAIFAIMYFFMIRPQNKKRKEIENFRKGLEVGQSVVTAGGIYGKIKEIEDSTVIVEVASGVKIKVDKNSIYADAQACRKVAVPDFKSFSRHFSVPYNIQHHKHYYTCTVLRQDGTATLRKTSVK